jgi:uncharacterized protein (TIGR03437 family)
VAILAAAIAALAPMASAYYYWTFFAGRSGPFTPIPARFDLSSLPNQTIPYLISSQGPAVMVPGDTFNALISQIRLAANVWNGVSTSAARLSFGGLSPMTQPDSTPEVDVVFDSDIPPGLLAYTQVTFTQNVSGALANGAAFIPVLNARMHFWNDLTVPQPPQASYSDLFFLTIVHEFGHALGLQHTLTSSVMSTQYTAAITKSLPLAADDVAGISLLYPANGSQGGYLANTGSISGTVSLSGGGMNMASVVALSTSGTAVSAITNPDGTYQINGIPPGQYYVYTHPLPPNALGEAYPDNMVPPQDPNGNPFPANIGFGTQFYGGTTDWTRTPQIAVTAGQSTPGINFNVSARSGPAIYGVTTYGYPAPSYSVPVGQSPMQAGSSMYLIFTGNGVTSTNKSTTTTAPGLNVSVIGGTAQASGLAYSGSGYDYVVINAGTVSSYTPTALAMTLNGDLYVLPNAFSVVPSAPPAITSVNGSTDGNGNTTVSIAGSNINANTKILFDGAQASLLQVNPDGSLLVTAPPASNGYQASVEALTPDGQTSTQFLGSATPPTFTYGGPSSQGISVTPPVVAAGTDSMVTITGFNTNFIQGQTVVGFGSSDITVTHVWVVSPTVIQMNISVSPSAAVVPTTVSVATGLQLATLSAVFQIGAANPGQITLLTPILNQATGLAGVPAGQIAVINTSGLPATATNASLAGWTLTIANQPVLFSLGSNGQLTAQVPAGLPIGPTVVQLTPVNAAATPPVLMQIDPPPPVITSVTDAALSVPNVAHAGDAVTLAVSGLADTLGNFPAASAIDVNVGGIDVTPASLTAVSGTGNPCQLQVTVPASLAAGAQAMTVRVGTRESATFTITIQ